MRRWAPWLLLGVGAALRLGYYLSRPSLSIDETMTSLEIGARSFAGLLHPLAYAQTAPPLFLWMVKSCTLIGGMNEYALRIVPLAAGFAVPFVVWHVGRQVLDTSGALLAMAIASFAPTLVQYSVIVKPYMTDAVIALVLAGCTLRVIAHPEAIAGWAWLAVGGLVAAFGSIAAPFFLGGVGAALALGIRPIKGATSGRLAALVLGWGAVYMALYSSLYRPVATSEYMQRFWGGAFPTPTRWAGWELVGRAVIQSLVDRPLPPWVPLPMTALLAAGFVVLARRGGRATAAVFGTPLLAILGASLLHRYPLSARVLVGVTPTVVLCCAAGLVAIGSWYRPLGGAISILVVLVLALVNVTHPYRTPALRPAIRALTQAAAPADPIYISSGAGPAWAFYTTDWSAPDTGYLRQVREWGGQADAPGFHNRASRGRAVTADDGPGLELRRSGRNEIYGFAAGIQWREVSGLTGGTPDPGWARHESERLRSVGSPVWLLIATAYAGSRAALFAAMDSAGGRVDVDSVVGGVERARVRFERTP